MIEPTSEHVTGLLDRAERHLADGQGIAAHKLYRRAVEVDPRSEAAYAGVQRTWHLEFVDRNAPQGPRVTDKQAMDAVRAEVAEWYQRLVDADPTNTAVRFALGQWLLPTEPERAKEWFEDALRIDPDHTGALRFLASSAAAAGDTSTQRGLLRRLADANPADVDALVIMMGSLPDAELAPAIASTLERFDDDPAVAARLTPLGDRTGDRALQERIVRLAATDPQVHPSRVAELVNLVGYERPAEVAALLRRATREDLQPLVDFLDVLGAAPTAEDLLTLAVPAGVDRVPLRARCITALAADGRPEEATQHAVGAILKQTADELWESVTQAGLDTSAIFAEVARQRIEASTALAELDLPHAVTGEPVTLASRRGAVVLVNFFYPGCGPCRNEFRYLHPVYESLADERFEIISVNGDEGEADEVAAFMAGHGYRFTPVLASFVWCREQHGVRSYPTNFLIDHAGRHVATPNIVNARTAARFATLVRELLQVAASEELRAR